MLLSLFLRFLKLLITSTICSLPIYLGYMTSISDSGILILSFILFIAAVSYDAYFFSFDFWKMKDYYLGLLLPFVIYIAMGFLTCLLPSPVVFNRIFLPLRFAGYLGISTMESIIAVSIVMLGLITILRFHGAKSGRLNFYMSVAEDEDM